MRFHFRAWTHTSQWLHCEVQNTEESNKARTCKHEPFLGAGNFSSSPTHNPGKARLVPWCRQKQSMGQTKKKKKGRGNKAASPAGGKGKEGSWWIAGVCLLLAVAALAFLPTPVDTPRAQSTTTTAAGFLQPGVHNVTCSRKTSRVKGRQWLVLWLCWLCLLWLLLFSRHNGGCCCPSRLLPVEMRACCGRRFSHQ